MLSFFGKRDLLERRFIDERRALPDGLCPPGALGAGGWWIRPGVGQGKAGAGEMAIKNGSYLSCKRLEF